jgi:flavin reductase (DIM6/NTAB) family NADH-FMN oxidoreductase RutF
LRDKLTPDRALSSRDTESLLVTDDFKQAMRRLASSIAIVTGGTGDGWTGIAATAVMSIAAEPPTLAVAVNRSTSLSPVLLNQDRFCVNLLARRHIDMVAVFGGKGRGMARFAVGDWRPSEHGLPVLSDAAASLECKILSRTHVATHTLFIGEVENIVNYPSIDPLLWADGRCASPSFIDRG